MFRRIAVRAFLAILAAVLTSSCVATLQRVSLPAGLEDDNSLKAKVLDASGVPALSITTFSETFDRSLDVGRGVDHAFVGGPGFKLGKDVNFGVLFTEALKSEAPKMRSRAWRFQSPAQTGRRRPVRMRFPHRAPPRRRAPARLGLRDPARASSGRERQSGLRLGFCEMATGEASSPPASTTAC